MMPTQRGSIRLFRFLGINVFLHWSWFVILLIDVQLGNGRYSSLVWNVFECLSLFAIVLMHEFGHALACRQVGGQANQIVLWPLGGVAYVSPPQRPGATLWSIAAGPLVNVALFPLLTLLFFYARSAQVYISQPDLYTYLQSVWFINLALLIFNLLPIYPLDGGQILRSLLWFPFGRSRSLMIASIIGFVGVAAMGAGAIAFAVTGARFDAIWFGVLSLFIFRNCLVGFKHAKSLVALEKAPRREGFACPECKAAPPAGAFWMCGNCRTQFDTFANHAVCPSCGAQFRATSCLACGKLTPIDSWAVPSSASVMDAAGSSW